MLKCLFIRKKLYDYFDGGLSGKNKATVKSHLDICSGCKQRLEEIENVVGLAAKKKAPEPGEGFWDDFRVNLDRRLNQELVSPIVIKGGLKYHLKPAFAYLFTLMFVLAIGVYFYKPHFSISRVDQELVDKIMALDELGEISALDHSEDAFLDEINLFFQFSQI